MKFLLAALLCVFLLFPSQAKAVIGVGVGTGKIQIDEKLRPGVIYELPPLTIINTGDEESDYEVDISYHEKQPQLRPQSSWFILNPGKFHLKPGESQIVSMKLNLPIRTEPGEYFAYVEGHPFKKSVSGNTVIGVAAATKLYFTVVPANPLAGIFYKLVSFWKVYAPWPQRTLLTLIIIAIVLFVKKHFNIQVNMKKPAPSHSQETKHGQQEQHDTTKKNNE